MSRRSPPVVMSRLGEAPAAWHWRHGVGPRALATHCCTDPGTQGPRPRSDRCRPLPGRSRRSAVPVPARHGWTRRSPPPAGSRRWRRRGTVHPWETEPTPVHGDPEGVQRGVRAPSLAQWVMAECRIGWLPFLFFWMDRQVEIRQPDDLIPLSMRFSEVVLRNIRLTFENDALDAQPLGCEWSLLAATCCGGWMIPIPSRCGRIHGKNVAPCSTLSPPPFAIRFSMDGRLPCLGRGAPRLPHPRPSEAKTSRTETSLDMSTRLRQDGGSSQHWRAFIRRQPVATRSNAKGMTIIN